MESFYSIQGEGTHTGKPSYFIRLAGCDVNCHWCDVKDSWDIDENQFKTVKEIVNDVLKSPAGDFSTSFTISLTVLNWFSSMSHESFTSHQ